MSDLFLSRSLQAVIYVIYVHRLHIFQLSLKIPAYIFQIYMLLLKNIFGHGECISCSYGVVGREGVALLFGCVHTSFLENNSRHVVCVTKSMPSRGL